METEETSKSDISIRVYKTRGRLELLYGDRGMREFPCITGSNPGDKEREGDRRTPIGRFRVVVKNPQSRFFLSLGLDYPRIYDADRALASELITYHQYRSLVRDLLYGDMTDEAVQNRVWKTPLGGEIFIHGCADARRGTAGCVALDNPDMLFLYHRIPLGTPVEILP